MAAAEDQHQDAEDHSQAHVDGGPDGRFPQGGDVGLPDVEEVVEGEQRQNDDDGDAPNEGRDSHVILLS